MPALVIGSTATQEIETNLDGFPVPGNLSPLYIGNTLPSADAITIDSGTNFPPGIAFRRNLGTPTAPSSVTAGTQLGYLDFRGYSGSQYWNAGSIDMTVDGAIAWPDGSLMPTQMRFAVSNGQRVYIPVEIRGDGTMEIGAIDGDVYYGHSEMGNTKLYVNSPSSSWGAIVAARPLTGAGFALRAHTNGETAEDYIIGASSGGGAGSFKFSVRGNGDVHVGGGLFLGSTEVGEALAKTQGTLGAFGVAGSGPAAVATGAESVAIGFGSVAEDDRVVSIGSAETQRRLVNLAPGARTTDAATKGQLDSGLTAVTATAEEARAVAQAQAGKLASLAAGPASAAAIADGAEAVALGSGAAALTANSTAVGEDAIATGKNSLSVGTGTRTNGENSVAMGKAALGGEANTVALGADSLATATAGTALGAGARAIRTRAVSVGYRSLAQGVSAIAIGDSAVALHDGAVALGASARTTANNQIVLGGAGTSVRIGDLTASTDAQVGVVEVVTVDDSGTLGRQRAAPIAMVEALSFRTLAIADTLQASDQQVLGLSDQIDLMSTDSRMTDQRLADIDGRFTILEMRFGQLEAGTPPAADAVVPAPDNVVVQAPAPGPVSVGDGAVASGDHAVAIGRDARAGGTTSLALGASATSAAPDAVAIGSGSIADASSATAIGANARATRAGSMATGTGAVAQGMAATAIGNGAVAAHDGSTALGAGARTTAANQLVLGATGTSVRIGDLGASTLAQSGPVEFVTVDTDGTLGRGQAASVASVEALGTRTSDLVQQLQLSDRQIADMSGRIGALENRLDSMNASLRGGIAAAMALGGTMVVPDSTISVNFNLATYRGEQGYSGTVVARVARRVYVSGGIAGSSATRSTGSRVGVAFGL